jgi:hypothetical protein
MKRLSSIISLLIFFAVFICGVTAADNFMLSPGLKVIASEYPMIKTGVAKADIHFTAEDFAWALGVEKVSKITVTKLPDPNYGTLKLGSQNVTEGQVISGKNLSSLRFVPTTDDEIETSFSFCQGSSPLGANIDCKVFALSKINAAPVLYQPEAIEVGVYSGIGYLGSLKASDAEGDPLRYEIVSAPSAGTIKLTDTSRGYYIYTPKAGFEGKDSFEVCVTDKYGNRSNSVKVTLRVDKPKVNELFADMEGHWANSAVITCARYGLITDVDGKFYPDEPMSRAEFLSLIMSAAGYTGFSIPNTGFADDDQIPNQYKGCIAAAEALGVIKGIEKDDSLYFCPNNQITRAEASVMISRLTGIELSGESVAVFADDSVPAWAISSMAALNSEGILRGNGKSLAPYDIITRAAGAQLASAILTR